jgi:hypothetical protein
VLRAQQRINKYQLHSLWFDPIGAYRRNLLHQKPAELVIQIHNKTGCLFIINKRIEGVIIIVLTSISIVHGLKPQSGQTRDYVIGIC